MADCKIPMLFQNGDFTKFFVKIKDNEPYLAIKDCIEASGLCEECFKDNSCLCYKLPSITEELIGPSGTVAPSGLQYYLPRYANVTLGSAVASVNKRWEIWTPTGCDETVEPFGDVGDVVFNVFSETIEITCSGGTTSTGGTLRIEWTGSDWDIGFAYDVQNCELSNGDGCAGGWSGNKPLQVRLRRAYDDYTTKEVQSWMGTENCQFGGPDNTFQGENSIEIAFENPCRVPEGPCLCTDYVDPNLINWTELATYPAPEESGVPSGCYGKPIDIDVACEGKDVSGTPSWVIWYRPYPNTVPVITGVAYDTINITDGPGIEFIQIGPTFSSQGEVREWVCQNLKFATVGPNWPSPDPNDLEYNWPYNDLYWNECDIEGGGPGGPGDGIPDVPGIVELVPC